MHKYMIMVSSITYAYRARDILQGHKIKCHIERISNQLRSSGCGYGVSVSENPEEVKKLLISQDIKVRDIIVI